MNWYLLNCINQTVGVLKEYQLIGSNDELGLSVDSSLNLMVEPTAGGAMAYLNGTHIDQGYMVGPEDEVFLRAGSDYYLARCCPDSKKWLSGLQPDQWILQNLDTGEIATTVPFREIPATAKVFRLDPERTVTTVAGARYSIFLKDFLSTTETIKVSPPSLKPPPLPPNHLPAETANSLSTPTLRADISAPAEMPVEEEIEINTVSGEFNCPHCWQHFDRGDVMWIAKHPDLRDPELGDEYPLRFFPTNFDELGRAVDAMGVRCSDMACPNCRSRLPPQYLDLPAHIFSIVGAPSAGKSYFLTSMVNQLEEALPSNFGLSFQDCDASGNALLSNMRAKLFSDSSNPADIALDKTVPGGEMFRTWERDGRSIKLPKPFTYLVSPFGGDEEGTRSLNLIFYDNAGEQFEPAERSEAAESTDEDATRHLASSDVIFFLYDPATNVKFRRRIGSKSDPQISDDKFLKLNRQDSIIAEMRIRIKSELNLNAAEKLEAPLAMIVGKCDLWADLLPASLVSPVTPDGLDLEAVAANSDLIRAFLLETSPAVVGNAESISREVVYFPVSPIGHSPSIFTPPGSSDERIGPVPGKVDPLYPEVPVIWTLARLYPDLIRVCHGRAIV